LLDRVDVGEPRSHHGLTVFPLTLRPQGESLGIRTLDEALAAGWLTIRELDEARVPEVNVRNESRRTIFLMAGELLLGGQQNRMIRDDVLLAPESGFVRVPVYCGEQNRWTAKREQFDAAGSIGGRDLRQMAAKGASQGEIWGNIASQLESAKVAAPTRSYQALHEDAAVRRETEEAADRLRGVCGGDTVGVVVFSGRRLLSADLFADPDLCAKLWRRLCRAHAVDSYLDGKGDTGLKWRTEGPNRGDVRRFLDAARGAAMSWRDTPGAGERLAVSGRAEGAALVWRERVIHAALFPAAGREQGVR
jgi:hypothetical protein